MNIAKLDNNGIVTNVIIVDDMSQAPDNTWVKCPDWIGIGMNINTPAPITPSAQENKQTAMILLQTTDWATIPDVGNPTKSNPYLANVEDFVVYRNAVRQYAIYPVAGSINWPKIPAEDWQTV